jgi:hypothetical protein
MFVHNLCTTIVGFLNYIRNALMCVSFSIKNHFNNALNDIDVICKSILLSLLKILLLISPK